MEHIAYQKNYEFEDSYIMISSEPGFAIVDPCVVLHKTRKFLLPRIAASIVDADYDKPLKKNTVLY